jgi:hypothetical protein
MSAVAADARRRPPRSAVRQLPSYVNSCLAGRASPQLEASRRPLRDEQSPLLFRGEKSEAHEMFLSAGNQVRCKAKMCSDYESEEGWKSY